MEQSEQLRKNRIVLLSIIGLPVTMMLAATWLWFFVVHGDLDLVGTLGTANRGDLVQPARQIDSERLLQATGQPFKYAQMPRKWTMLVPSSGPVCDDFCEHSLYITRQIHIAIGKEFGRLQRLYISDVSTSDTGVVASTPRADRPAPSSLASLLQSEHRGMSDVVVTGPVMNRLFPEYTVDRSTWYLVDPAGWIMMSYNNEVPYKDVIADLKFLLKNSSE